MLISDHLNLTGKSPLSGAAAARRFPPRFTDLTDLYSADLRAIARSGRPDLAKAVYAGLPGPHYETPAEIRMLAGAGAGLVGMSTVLEAIAARHLGARVLGISLVTNIAAGLVRPGTRPRRGRRDGPAVGPPTGRAPGGDAAEGGLRRGARRRGRREQASAWIADDIDEQDKAELTALLADESAAGAAAELADRFARRLSFGTAGLRGAVAAGPNRMNTATVTATTAALASWLLKRDPALPSAGVVVGCDARHRSDEFAAQTARVLAGAGIRVHLLPGGSRPRSWPIRSGISRPPPA